MKEENWEVILHKERAACLTHTATRQDRSSSSVSVQGHLKMSPFVQISLFVSDLKEMLKTPKRQTHKGTQVLVNFYQQDW